VTAALAETPSRPRPSATIRLVALDLDGTLMEDDMVIRSARVRQVISEAHHRGVVVTLATGRSLDHTEAYAAQLGITAPLICYQGGLIQRTTDPAPLYSASMPRELVRAVLEHRARAGWHLALYTTTQVFLDELRYDRSFYLDMLGSRVSWVDNLDGELERVTPVKLVILAEPPEAERALAELQKRFGGSMEITRSHARIVEASPLGVSKGDALARLTRHLGLEQQQVLAVGDQDNDLQMVRWAGIGVAMGNATAAVKAAADWVAPPVAEDGAAVAIERFVLRGSTVAGSPVVTTDPCC